MKLIELKGFVSKEHFWSWSMMQKQPLNLVIKRQHQFAARIQCPKCNTKQVIRGRDWNLMQANTIMPTHCIKCNELLRVLPTSDDSVGFTDKTNRHNINRAIRRKRKTIACNWCQTRSVVYLLPTYDCPQAFDMRSIAKIYVETAKNKRTKGNKKVSKSIRKYIKKLHKECPHCKKKITIVITTEERSFLLKWLNVSIEEKKGGGSSAKKKGAGFERSMVKAFTKWWGEPFKRCAGSGGDYRADTFKRKGDIETTDDKFPFTIECKNQEKWNLETFIKNVKTNIIWTFWSQCVLESQINENLPLLILKKNNHAPLYMIEFDVVKDILHLLGSYFMLNYNGYILVIGLANNLWLTPTKIWENLHKKIKHIDRSNADLKIRDEK